jgi:hypothetical protein
MTSRETAATLQGLQEGLASAERLAQQPTPANLDLSMAILRQVAARLKDSLPGLPSHRGNPELLASAADIRRRVQRLGRLLDQAAALHAGRKAVVGAVLEGYTPAGEPAGYQPAGRLLARI